MTSSSPRWSVVVPTWRRPVDLRRCLVALSKQTVAELQVVVGRRVNDEATAAVVAEVRERFTGGHALEEAVIGPEDNLVKSMNAALGRTRGEFVALNDDDAESPPDWLEKMEGYFGDERLVGVGGRDWQPHQRWDEPEVGMVRWYGKVIGNHHLGAGPAREVDLLKGVNCAFRGDVLRAVGFETRLLGGGNVTNWEMSLCFTLRKLGWKLVYDPAIAIDHHVAQRFDGDTNNRGGFAGKPYRMAIHNETVSILEFLPMLRWPIFLAWSVLIGTRGAVGLAQVFRLLLLGQRLKLVVDKCGLTVAGRVQGLATVLLTNTEKSENNSRVPPASTPCRVSSDAHNNSNTFTGL